MVLNTALIVLVVSALISLLLKAGGRQVKPDPSTGQAILEYGVGMRLLGWICGLLPAVGVALLATLHSPPPTAGDRNAVVLLIAGFGSLGSLLIIESKRRVIFDADGITDRSPWWGVTRLRWNDIVWVKYSRLSRGFVLRGSGGSRVRVSSYLVGIATLVEYLSARLDRQVYEQAVETYRQASGQAL